MPEKDITCLAISIVLSTWLQDILKSYEGDDQITKIMATMEQDPTSLPHYTLDGSLIRYRGRLQLVGEFHCCRASLLQEMHTSPYGGHSGIQDTYMRLKTCKICKICARSKPDLSPSLGLLQPLPIPDQPWTHITIDFVEGLPKAQGKDVILMMVDRLTKYGHFIPLSHPFTS